MTGQGHNSIANGQLRSLVERIERANEEKAAIQADIAEIYAECKAFGFDKKIVRKVVQIRAQDSAQRQEEEALVDLYMSALGMTPHETAGPPPRLARPEPSQAPVGAADNSGEPPCKPAAPGATAPMTAGEAGEAANKSENRSSEAKAQPTAPAEPDGAGEDDVPVSASPAQTDSAGGSPSGAESEAQGASVDAEPLPAPATDDLEVPAFMDRRAAR